ncbi:MAG TPA: energy-coupling factor transporter transmembrane component T [Bacilli bacterium]|jgi:energy-coupling factor transport system permease protein|nr:energy-coupling factor transporter transmembrane component T [Bacilli bacterium]NCA95081.1 energy-coupling factor transporter transmembrane protein EcfT [Campylobacterota bacterium]NLB40345.1 energy-coupling factor transporter transmembrane protein EcfT [Erysipelotrichaceae bacterium]HOH67921.1 energy-coupling factor transporter transmembrane component T [Bacilli bacterium]HPV70208.1 energy-coupling factor transporter transmembrane component T [Bacilli bacterium]
MKSLSLGRYAPFNSLVHRLDPRSKLLILVLMMVAVFYGYSSQVMTFVMGGILLLIIFVMLLVSRVSLRQLFSSLKALWIMIIILLLINVLVPPLGASRIAFSVGTYHIFWESILQSAKIILRLVMMISLTLILTATTKPLDLTYALEWYMYPLKLIKFPTHEIAMTISIALRFIPTLLDETMRIMNAQASRGVDFEHGKVKEKIKAILSLIVPLFMSAFQRSEELANAMEARGYNPRAKRTRYRNLHWGGGDTFSLLLATILTAGVILTSVMNWNYVEMIFNITTWSVGL